MATATFACGPPRRAAPPLPPPPPGALRPAAAAELAFTNLIHVKLTNSRMGNRTRSRTHCTAAEFAKSAPGFIRLHGDL